MCFQPRAELRPSGAIGRCNACGVARKRCTLIPARKVAPAKGKAAGVSKEGGVRGGTAAGSKRKEAPVSPKSQPAARNVRTRSQDSLKPQVIIASRPVGAYGPLSGTQSSSGSRLALGSSSSSGPVTRAEVYAQFKAAMAKIEETSQRHHEEEKRRLEAERRTREDTRRLQASVMSLFMDILAQFEQRDSSAAESEKTSELPESAVESAVEEVGGGDDYDDDGEFEGKGGDEVEVVDEREGEVEGEAGASL